MTDVYDLASMDARASYTLWCGMRQRAVRRLRETLAWRKELTRRCLAVSWNLECGAYPPEQQPGLEADVARWDAICLDIRHRRVPQIIEWIRAIDAALYEDADSRTRH